VPGGHLSPNPAKVRERAVRSLISAGGVVLICPVGARTAAGRGWRLGSRRGRAACASKACPKQSRRAYAPPQGPPTRFPPITSPGTLPSHTSGSPHPDTRGWAKPRHASHGPTQRRWATKPTTLCPLSSSEHTLPAALLHASLRWRSGSANSTHSTARQNK
jgi:hypothetical protein